MIDWQRGPANRWAFQKIDEVVPTRHVSRGDGPVDPLVATLPEFEPSPEHGLWRLTEHAPVSTVEALRNELTATFTDALIVVRDGEIVVEHYDNGMMPRTRHLLMSVSKTFAGILAGQAIEAGLLDEDALVPQYVPELEGSAFGTATIRDVLDMVVAVEFSEDYADPESEVQRQDRVAGWRDRVPGDPEDTYEFLPTLDQSGSHGERFQYCSADTDALGWILERVTGLPYAQLLQEKIWEPLGATRDAFITADPGGFPMANGGLCTTARDLAVYGQAILDRRDFIPRAWFEETVEGGDPAKAEHDLGAIAPGGSYRGHFWHLGDAHRSIMGWGIYSQYLFIDPVERVVIVKFSTETEAVTTFSRQRHLELFRHLIELTAGVGS